ncbi:hypothetical protein IWQ60_009576 [Tieghemiomyces parasiticus]|uniref:Protein-serine/threonine kinase n=1 Tax=Tieghemiomyces parasiticus TaxID=78921 RepID=A0A9W8DP49_9FUNG|nr:hypothetical protein IWQ60_009576 [Tieghemiomyces parasiticus]
MPPPHQYAAKEIWNLSIQELIRFGKPPLSKEAILKSARFTQNELPIRLARRVAAFQKLPYIVGLNPHVQAVYQLYYETFETLRAFPPIETLEQEREYTQSLEQQIKNLSQVIPQMAQGFLECKKYMRPAETRVFLNDLINSRIGLRLIGEQHVALHETNEDYIGVVHTRLQPAKLLQNSAAYVHDLCEINYGSAPDFIINGDTETRVHYVPVHLEYMACELLKNCFRATTEFGLKRHAAGRLPPIEITIARGAQDISLRFRDQGGGISSKDRPHIFEFSYTTVRNEAEEEENDDTMFSVTSKLAMQAGVGGPIGKSDAVE